MQTKIGIDVNGVIADSRTPRYNTKKYSIFSVMDGSIPTLKKLADQIGAENIFIISRVKIPQLSLLTGIWLETHKFLQRTGISLDNVIICHNLKDKAPIAQELGITHFIDDRLKVLKYFPDNIRRIAFNPEQSELDSYPEIINKISIVKNWDEVEKLIYTK